MLLGGLVIEEVRNEFKILWIKIQYLHSVIAKGYPDWVMTPEVASISKINDNGLEQKSPFRLYLHTERGYINFRLSLKQTTIFNVYLNPASAAFTTSPSWLADIPETPIAPIIFPLA